MNYSLAAVPAAAALAGAGGKAAWQVLVPEDEGVAVLDMDVFCRGIVLQELRAGRPALRMVQFWREKGGEVMPECRVSQVHKGGVVEGGGESLRVFQEVGRGYFRVL
jgi:protease II